MRIRRVIEGKVYDTTKAKLVMKLPGCPGIPRLDQDHERTWLLLSRRGQFFLAGEGGPLTRWKARNHEGFWDFGEGIEPITDDQAKSLMEQHGGPVESHFVCEEA